MIKNNDAPKIAMIFGISRQLVFALANTLLGLKKYSPALLEHVIVYHDGLADADMQALREICPCEFRCYQCDAITGVDPKSIASYSLLMFAHYECFNLLHDYDITVWNDVDILVQGDITSGILAAAESGLGMCPVPREEFTNRDNFKKDVPGYDMGATLYNSGILIVSRKLVRWQEIYQWLLTATTQYAAYLEWPDQGVLNLMLQQFRISPYPLELAIYCRHAYATLTTQLGEYMARREKRITAERSNKPLKPLIVHAYGPQKFWDFPPYFMGFTEWSDNNREWSKLRAKYLPQNFEPEVSIVIPTLNAEKYLEEAITSILVQSLVEFELIVVDGGSTDKTLDILKAFNDPRIIVVTDTTVAGNISTSLNLGLSKARGAYIARMDADDIALPYRLQAQVAFLKKNTDISLCFTDVYAFHDIYACYHACTDPETVAGQLVFATPIVHPSVMWRREDFAERGLCYNPEYQANEDLELWQRASKTLKLCGISQSLLMYREHGEKTSRLKTFIKTRAGQLQLMARSLDEMGVKLSENTLLLIDQRDNTTLMSDDALAAAFREACTVLCKLAATQTQYPKEKFARQLLSLICWVFSSRVDPRNCGMVAYFGAMCSLMTTGRLWGESLRKRFMRGKTDKLVAMTRRKLKPSKLLHQLIMHPKLFVKIMLRSAKQTIWYLYYGSTKDDSRLLRQILEKKTEGRLAAQQAAKVKSSRK